MKHKAQEWLERIAIVELEEVTERTVRDFYNEEIGNLQDLINCQLTVEEIRDCIIAVDCIGNVMGKEKHKRIRTKLLKQKELWEEE